MSKVDQIITTGRVEPFI